MLGVAITGRLKMSFTRMLLVVLVAALYGCAGGGHSVKRPNFSPIISEPETVYFPEPNVENAVEIGENMVSKAYRNVYQAIKTSSEVRIVRYRGDSEATEIRVPQGTHKAILSDSEGVFYSKDDRNARTVAGIYVPNNDSQKTEVFFLATNTGQPINYDMPGVQFVRTTTEEWAEDSFKRELVYAGISGSTLSIIYREFKDDIARPAFSQELKYDLSQGKEIGYKGARFEVLKATNTSIRYKVRRQLD
jgi:hypothetical protein